MRKHITNILLVLILLAGLSLLLYPSFSDWWNRYHQSRAIASYTDIVTHLDTGESERMWAEAEAYNRSLWTRVQRYQPSDEEHEEYSQILDVSGTGIMGYIEIPKINVSLPIYHGTDEAVLQIAVGHIEGSSLPVGGKGTHCVLSGHRGLPSARLFTDLDDLVESDTFTIDVLGQTLTYQIDQIRIVLPAELDDIELVEGQDYCTLVTCTPYGVNSHRMLVRGRRIANVEEEKIVFVPADATLLEPIMVAPVVGGVLLVMVLAWVGIRDRQRRRQARSLKEAQRRNEATTGEERR